jgi:chromosome segregation ATPase
MEIDWNKIESNPDKSVKIPAEFLLNQKKKISNLETQIKSLNEEGMGIIQQYQSIQKEFDGMKGEKEILENTIKNLQKKIEDIKVEKNNLEGKQDQLEQDFESKISKLNEEHINTTKNLENQIINLEGKIKQFNELITNKDNQINSLKQNIAEIQKEKGNIEEYNKKLAEQQSQIQNLSVQLQEKSSSLNNIQAKITELSNSNEQLKDVNQMLENELNDLNEQYSELKKEQEAKQQEGDEVSSADADAIKNALSKILPGQEEMIAVILNLSLKPNYTNEIDSISSACKIPKVLLKTRVLNQLQSKNVITVQGDNVILQI